MARTKYDNALKSRTNRLKLPIQKAPFKCLIAPNVYLCYGRNEGAGTWSVKAGWLKRFALADDHEDANGVSVMTYWQALKHALKLLRGSEGDDTEKPVTVAGAFDAYETDLKARRRSKNNAVGYVTA